MERSCVKALICSNHALAAVCSEQCKQIKQLEESMTLIHKMYTCEEESAEKKEIVITRCNSIHDKDQIEISRLKKVVRDLNLEIAIIKSGV
jgi:hypothetical protein